MPFFRKYSQNFWNFRKVLDFSIEFSGSTGKFGKNAVVGLIFPYVFLFCCSYFLVNFPVSIYLVYFMSIFISIFSTLTFSYFFIQLRLSLSLALLSAASHPIGLPSWASRANVQYPITQSLKADHLMPKALNKSGAEDTAKPDERGRARSRAVQSERESPGVSSVVPVASTNSSPTGAAEPPT